MSSSAVECWCLRRSDDIFAPITAPRRCLTKGERKCFSSMPPIRGADRSNHWRSPRPASSPPHPQCLAVAPTPPSAGATNSPPALREIGGGVERPARGTARHRSGCGRQRACNDLSRRHAATLRRPRRDAAAGGERSHRALCQCIRAATAQCIMRRARTVPPWQPVWQLRKAHRGALPGNHSCDHSKRPSTRRQSVDRRATSKLWRHQWGVVLRFESGLERF